MSTYLRGSEDLHTIYIFGGGRKERAMQPRTVCINRIPMEEEEAYVSQSNEIVFGWKNWETKKKTVPDTWLRDYSDKQKMPTPMGRYCTLQWFEGYWVEAGTDLMGEIVDKYFLHASSYGGDGIKIKARLGHEAKRILVAK